MAKEASSDLSQAQVQAMIDELSTKIDTLRVRYEQYFQGAERRPPIHLRKDVVRLMRTLENAHITNTALKFHLRQLVQRFNTYGVYWNRVLRQIENGTFKRHILKAQRRQQARGGRMRSSSTPQAEAGSGDRKKAREIGDAADAFLASLEGGGLLDGLGDSFDDDGFDDTFGGRPDSGLNPVVDPFGGGTPRRSPSGAFSALASASSGPALDSNPFNTRPDTGLNPVADPFGGAGASAFSSRPESGLNPVLDPFASSSSSSEVPDRFAAQRTPTRDRPRAVPPPRPRRKSPPPPPRRRQSKNDGSRDVYDQFVAARRQAGINKDLSYDKFERTLARQKQAVQQKHGGKDVGFRVVVKNGKPILQPVVKS